MGTPAVYVDAILRAERSARFRGLLNSGAVDFEPVLPKSAADEIGLKKIGKCELYFGGRRSADVGEAEISIKSPKGEDRGSKLMCAVLPDEVIDCLVLGTEAQAKLKIIPNTVTGEPIFLE